MVADLAGTEALIDLASLTAALGVISAAIVGLARTPPVKWLGRTLVGQPVSTWLRRELRDEMEPILGQLQPNGGTSTRDAIDRVESGMVTGSHRMSRIEGQLTALTAAVDPMLRDWRLSHPESRPDLDDDGGQT